MNTKDFPDSLYELPFVLVKDGAVIEVSKQFIDGTEFNRDELLNKSIEDFFDILRVGPNIDIHNIDEEIDYFLFTKFHQVRLVNIEAVGKENEKLIVFKLKSNSNFELKFPFISKLCSDDYDGIAIFSLPDITLLKANKTFVSFFDEPFNKLENCIGKKISEFVTGFQGSTSEKLWDDIIKTGQTFYTDEYMYDRLERGITYWKSTLIPIYEDGKLKYCVEMTREITEQVIQRKKLEEKEETIRRQNEQLKWQADLLNLSSEAIFTWKLGGGITYWNKGAEQLYGYSKEEALGKVSHDLLKTVHPFSIDELEYILKDNEIWRGMLEHTCKDGRKLIISTSHQIITDDNGHKTILEINRDVTEVKKMEKELKKAQEKLLASEIERSKALEQSLEMKDDFLSLISHEFRTPLNVISTALQAIKFLCANDLTERLNNYLNTIRQNTFRQLRLVNNLLDITRADAGRIKIHKKNLDIVFLTNSIVQSVQTFASQKGVIVTVTSSIEKKIIGIDDEKYERILLNLLSNAIKFTPADKIITVKIRAMKNKVRIEVKDNGIGIPEDKIEVIFERFGQVDSSLSRQAEGSGIGLSLVKRLVEALGGSISVKSKLQKGSTFTIHLPDETVIEEPDINPGADLMDNRLVQVATVEFSDIYL